MSFTALLAHHVQTRLVGLDTKPSKAMSFTVSGFAEEAANGQCPKALPTVWSSIPLKDEMQLKDKANKTPPSYRQANEPRCEPTQIPTIS
jgi:hypothetical protein